MTRWQWRLGAVGLLTVAGAMVTAGTTAAQDTDGAEALAGLLPDDLDALSNDQVDVVIGDLYDLLGEVPAATGGSSSLTGPCGGFAFSFDEDGNVIDAAFDLGDDAPPQDLIDGGQAFTSDNPFVVDTGGSIKYIGFAPRSAPGPKNHTYSLEVAGVEVASGGDPNDNEKNRNAGTIDVGDELPIETSLKFEAGGRMDAPEFESCVGEGHVELNGSGLFGPIGLVGIAITAVGLAGLFVARPARTWRQ